MFEKSWMFFAFIGVSAAFALVSLLVVISHRNRKFINWKLRLGALLLTFTAVNANCREPMVTCYEPVAPNPVTIDNKFYSEGQVTVKLSDGRIISGSIRLRPDENISYAITSGTGNITVQAGVLSESDGSFNPETSLFIIKLGDKLAGSDSLKLKNLYLKFYKSSPGYAADPKYPAAVFELIIK